MDFWFSVSHDNPFVIFRILQKIAENLPHWVYDLSRGDPGLWFSPSVKGREFYAFLLMVDVQINNTHTKHSPNSMSWNDIQNLIWRGLSGVFHKNTLIQYCAHLRYFIDYIVAASYDVWDPLTEEEVIDDLFLNSNLAGWKYHLPAGEKVVRIVLAYQMQQKYSSKVVPENFILTNWASHAIATIFDIFSDPKIGYLHPWDTVVSISPNYSPYNDLFRHKQLEVIPIDLDIDSWKLDYGFSSQKKVKLISIIHPNNPTGHRISRDDLQKIAQFAQKNDAIIITDEVYSEFFYHDESSIWEYAPERTIFLGWLSKIQRSTWIRFGYMYFSDECLAVLREKLWEEDIIKLFINAKAPGWIEGIFYHVSSVPWPSQFLGLSHLVFWDEEKLDYIHKVKRNMETFFTVLWRPYQHTMYFSILSLDARGDFQDPEALLVALAREWIVVLPAYNFYASWSRDATKLKDIRISIPNISHDRVIDAAKIIRNFL